MTRARDLAAFVSNADGDIKFDTDTLFIDSSTNKVGIGTASPATKLSLVSNGAGGDIHVKNGSGQNALLEMAGNNNTAGSTSALYGQDSSGNAYAWQRANAPLLLGTNNTEAMRIDSSGNVGIGTASPDGNLHVRSTIAEVYLQSDDGQLAQIVFGDASDSSRGRIYYDSSENMVFANNNLVERMRISSAGSTTLTSVNDHPLILNRTGNTGVFAEFKEGGTSRGAIDGNGTRLLIRSIGSASGLRMDGGNITPFYGGGESDNGIDLGYSAGRFKTVFAGTGSINTSDENEKQDIAELTDAEIIAAKAISKLFKTYKWKDAVSSKGDAARTHAGVIAQQVQTAMSDAGLDSSKYGFWCSDTWWEVTEEIAAKEAVFHEDGSLSHPEEPAFTQKETYTKEEDAPEGATKRTRMGIRYAELLAFIGAATEQRLTSIETQNTTQATQIADLITRVEALETE